MSAVENAQAVWSGISKEDLDSKYEKCRNITEEIYKRINITFQIKKLETGSQSDVSYHSDQIDSNELSNGTDLFACDKSDSIPSSTEAEPSKPQPHQQASDKVLNNNNNEETKKQAAAVSKRPRKRFRKRVKKRPSLPRSDTDGSSDEALPLSRALPNIVVLTKDLKPKILTPDKKTARKSGEAQKKTPTSNNQEQNLIKDKTEPQVAESNTLETEAASKLPKDEKSSKDSKMCTICNLPFRSVRGLRRHLALSHITPEEPKPSRSERREVKPT